MTQETKKLDDYIMMCGGLYSQSYETFFQKKEEVEQEYGIIMKFVHNKSNTDILRQHKFLINSMETAIRKMAWEQVSYPPIPGQLEKANLLFKS